jgi:virginiamycin B lyase
VVSFFPVHQRAIPIPEQETGTMRKRLMLFCSFALLVPTSYAGTLMGAVKGPDGTPFEGAFVEAQNTKTKITVSVLSSEDGKYRVENLPAGSYQLKTRAIGYKADPQNGVTLAAGQKASYNFALQKGIVRWTDLSDYQASKLLPAAPGKDAFFGKCLLCHGFQTRMASVHRDEEGWRDRVNYMRESMNFFLGAHLGGPTPFFTDQNAIDVTSYLNLVFGQESALPASPTAIPEYKDVTMAFSNEAMKIVYVEYELPGPNRMPWSAAPDKDGNFWIPCYGTANKIAKLNPKTGEVQEFPVPNNGTAGIHSAMPAPDGSVWLTEQGSNKLGRWDPATKKISEYQDSYLPGQEGLISGGSKHTTQIALDGTVWTTGEPLTSFNPKTGKFTKFDSVPDVYGIAIDQKGNPWFAEYAPGGSIGTVDPKTGKVTKFKPPSGEPRRIAIDSDGTIWFAEHTAGKLGHFYPKSQSFKEYTLPGAKPTPYALGIDKDHKVWYSSEDMDYIGRLDPISGKIVQYPFDHSENTMREFFLDSEGYMWFGSPANNIVGYFYLAGDEARKADVSEQHKMLLGFSRRVDR